MRVQISRTSFIASLLIAVAVVVPVVVTAALSGIDQPGSAVSKADPVSPVATDLVTVYNSGPLDSDVGDRAFAAARAAGGSAAIGRSASLGMTDLVRGSAVVQRPPAGYAYPMGTTMLPLDLIGRTMGREVSAVLAPDTLVMGALTASLRGAQVGDTVTVTASWGGPVNYVIAAVVDDAIIGGTELLMSTEGADRLGISRLSRVVIWGFDSRGAIESALAAEGLVSTSIRIRKSWDPTDPDFTLGMAETKAALGEFAFRVNGNGSLSLDSGWKNANITSGSIGQLQLSSGCHKTVRPDLQAAMDELATHVPNLTYTINYYDANRAGGCYYPRFNRLTPSSSIGFLSRHSWGMAVDTNTIGSCQGCAPPDMNCDTVRIFRKHGFAWGGNFLRPDGMHFEWVGEKRDHLPYPSRFCPNIAAPLTSELRVEDTERATFYANDGLISGDAHE